LVQFEEEILLVDAICHCSNTLVDLYGP
jgi:hypothetical protein